MTRAVRIERGISAPPEVVFSTATDPDRLPAWLPGPLRQDGCRSELSGDDLSARWSTPDQSGWTAELTVTAVDAGGCTARLRLDAGSADQPLTDIADQALTRLAREVADSVAAG